ncbi:MAG: iron ABC transporter permease [Bacteroidota bacterium]|nr:iron ABC transporter permease [Bacteroidota bacterium]
MKASLKHILILVCILTMAFALNVLLAGSSVLKFSEINFDDYIFRNIRLSKALTALLCGISLPIAGQILQVLFRNPLAGPYVLGISSASSLAVGIAIMALHTFGVMGYLFFSKTAIILAAFAGSLFCTLLILFVAKKVISNVFLLLIGLMLGQIFGALQSFVEYFSTDKGLREFVMWSFGSLGNSTYTDITLFAGIGIGLIIILFMLTKPFQVFLMGQNYANALGVDFAKYRIYFIVISSLLTALATAFCGPIAFVGLSIPIMTRLIYRTSDQKFQLTACLLLGGITMLICDTLCYTILPDRVIPINVITTLFGSPFIIYLLFKTRNW